MNGTIKHCTICNKVIKVKILELRSICSQCKAKSLHIKKTKDYKPNKLYYTEE